MNTTNGADLTASRGVGEEEPPAATNFSRVGGQTSKPVTGSLFLRRFVATISSIVSYVIISYFEASEQ